MDETPASVTEDHVLGGKVTLRQPAKGYRAGLDAALLAAACDAKPGQTVIDAGCGVGAVMLAAATRRPGVSFVGVEREAAALALAQVNIAANGFEGRVEATLGDIAAPDGRCATRFDAALSNPPFFDDRAALRGPHPAKEAAFIAEAGLGAWIGFLLRAVRDGGSITVIHRTERLADLLALLGAKAGSFQIRPVHPYTDEPASRVLVRAVRGGRAPLRLLPAMALHERGGAKHTAKVEAILRGEFGPAVALTAHVALLRAVNVGGRGKVAMADLRALLAELGFEAPQSLVQSGNLVFRSQPTGAALEALLEQEAKARLGLATDILVRTAREWAEIVAANPYPAMARDDPSHLLVMPLKAKPDAAGLRDLRSWIPGRETIEAVGRELYIAYRDGVGTSKLTNAVIERRIKTRGTARNWNTVTKLAALLAD